MMSLVRCSFMRLQPDVWQKPVVPDGVHSSAGVAADTYYANAVLWAAETGVTSGTSDTTFSTSDNCTRAQIVTFLFRCLGEE